LGCATRPTAMPEAGSLDMRPRCEVRPKTEGATLLRALLAAGNQGTKWRGGQIGAVTDTRADATGRRQAMHTNATVTRHG